MQNIQEIEKKLKSLLYLQRVTKIKTWLEDRVIGFNAAASSLIRKPEVLKKLQSDIQRFNIPVFIDDPGGDKYVDFKLLIKL